MNKNILESIGSINENNIFSKLYVIKINKKIYYYYGKDEKNMYKKIIFSNEIIFGSFCKRLSKFNITYEFEQIINDLKIRIGIPNNMRYLNIENPYDNVTYLMNIKEYNIIEYRNVINKVREIYDRISLENVKQCLYDYLILGLDNLKVEKVLNLPSITQIGDDFIEEDVDYI